jgi:MFS family permease
MAKSSLLNPIRSRFFARQRASVPFITSVVTLGLFVDTLNYSLVLSVFPFRLEYLGYNNVSALNGWLLFIYVRSMVPFCDSPLRDYGVSLHIHHPLQSGALVLATPPIAALSEYLRSRRSIMLGGLFSLFLSQLLLMEARTFAVMCVGRLFEGISSSAVLTAGLALICDTTPEKDIGSQMGVVMVGVPLGTLLGPPVGGALYARWGYRAPFVFGMIFTALDLVGRVLVIEGGLPHQDKSHENEANDLAEKVANTPGEPQGQTPIPSKDSGSLTAAEQSEFPSPSMLDNTTNQPHRRTSDASILHVFWRFMITPRPLVVFLVVFFCSAAFLAADVTIPLHTQEVWGLNSTKVGLVFIAAIIPTLICRYPPSTRVQLDNDLSFTSFTPCRLPLRQDRP